MVDICLESDVATVPPDCYISIRVGDAQKLAKLPANRTFSFTKADKWRHGKVEIFKRIGHASIDMETAGEMHDVNVDCQHSGFGLVQLRVATKDKVADTASTQDQTKSQTCADPQKAKSEAKQKAAKDYLHQHRLEARLSEIMKMVLRDRPEDPSNYIAAKLTGTSGGAKQESVTRQPADHAVSRSRAAPVIASAQTKSAASLVPKLQMRCEKDDVGHEKVFRSYYKKQFLCLTPKAMAALHVRFLPQLVHTPEPMSDPFREGPEQTVAGKVDVEPSEEHLRMRVQEMFVNAFADGRQTDTHMMLQKLCSA
eukprot:TRINITY_DN44636_c0_g1_i1.p1 TRINITY_DN44636_c0_g1~~TRINITY_DN44636_c0_g1_i1.p1  ORF type:complete len:336 (-),score=52.97 TRINITY_DN44636_c0_g1_i1:271-1203(-)